MTVSKKINTKALHNPETKWCNYGVIVCERSPVRSFNYLIRITQKSVFMRQIADTNTLLPLAESPVINFLDAKIKHN